MRDTKVLGIRLSIPKHTDFLAKCKENQTTHSRVIKKMINNYLKGITDEQ